ncbi:BON domain-containing protein [Burkholderia latens]|uniref:BON domain-containing protein n=1 Tax=Burkholderia latens TaxID=488446 RepID=A0A6H9SUH1_9BURK|nr:BON domain-containing protein [Burkholderia latens]KAB0643190.1 BON domain-containing protein [Burkholderia latens]VWB85852.1 transporter [Burkholderia latens]
MNKTSHLSTLLAASAAFLLAAAPLTNVQAQTQSASSSDSTMSSKSDQPVTDTWITTKVKSELATTKGVKSTDIEVKTVDGVVTLTGVLPSKVAVKKAVAVTRSIKGVKHVDSSGLKAKA